MSIAKKLLEELRSDDELRREFVEEIAAELLRDRRVRIAALRALRRDIATKQDIETARKELREETDRLREYIDKKVSELRSYVDQKVESIKKEFREEIDSLRKEMREVENRLRKEFREELTKVQDRIQGIEYRLSSIESRLSRVEGMPNLFVKVFIAFNLPILIALIGILLKMVFG